MKLYSTNLSNFSTKSRIVVYEKGLEVEIAAIPGNGLRSHEYLQINPLGKIPTLEVEGLIIAESEVINEYLEDKFPEPPLMPASPEGKARVRSFTRYHDLYLDPPLRALFPHLNPRTRDEPVATQKLGELQSRLDLLEAMIADDGYAASSEFTLADCAIAPTIFFVTNMLPGFGAKPPLEGRPKLAGWWARVQARPSVAKAMGEMNEALQAMIGSGRQG